MLLNLPLLLGAVFVSVAALTGAIAWTLFARAAPAQRRLDDLLQNRPSTGLIKEAVLVAEAADPRWEAFIERLPPPLDASKALRRNLTFAGFEGSRSVAFYLLSQPIAAVLVGLLAIYAFDGSMRLIGAILGALVGFMLPSILLGRQIRVRQKEIENGLADALDLLVLCLEAGSSLDQAIVKATAELQVSYPALADQLRMVINEMRAGKPRLEAFRGFAARTKVDDARALVTMLVQTDKFGTSIAQALRTHAEVCRTKRRQRAEERGEKVGVKLVFPLVFCLFPALFVVILGPAIIQFLQVFSGQP